MFDPFANGTSKKGNIGRAYISPGQIAMGGLETDATPMASYIPGGHFGGKTVGKGTVIPHHKPGRGGGSLGYNPHKPPHKCVIIDPHVPGRAVTLDLGKIKPEDSESAYNDGMAFANEIMEDPPDQMDGIEMKIEEGPRLGAYAATRILAENFGATPDDTFAPGKAGYGTKAFQAAPPGQSFGGVAASSSPAAPKPQVYTMPPASIGAAARAAFGVPNIGQSGPPPIHIVSGTQSDGVHVQSSAPGPLARFRPEPPRPTTAPPPPRPPSPAQVVDLSQQAAGPPAVKVTFDFGEQFGQFPAQYHQVIRAPHALILAWDTRWQYAEPYSPEHLQNEFAVQVAGDPEVHLVMVPADTFTFEFLGFRFYHLGIIQSMSVN
jgi:hypothetical protein